MNANPPVVARTNGHKLIELAGILAFGGFIVAIVARVVREAESAAEWFWVALGSALGYLLADFMSGFVHWVGDTLGDETTPVVGPNFIGPFRDHHVDPKGITRHGFLETNGNNCIVSVPFLLAMWLVFPHPRATGLFIICLFTSAALFTFGTNQFHKWAHADTLPPFVRTLQRWGLILSPEHHQTHHTLPFDRYYCITVGWMNEPLTRMRFFPAMEWIVRKLRPDLLHRERAKLIAEGLIPADELAADAGALERSDEAAAR